MFKDYVNKDVNESVELALKRAHKSHELYNDVVTFIDPSVQIANMPKEGKMKGIPIALKAVSYTHLTLPTNIRV